MSDEMPGMAGGVSKWQYLAGEAQAGRLRLDPSVARDLAVACDRRISALNDMLTTARQLSTVEGFGELPSGVLLATKFSQKGSGGTNSLDVVLQQHIDAVKAMQIVFNKSIEGYTQQDSAMADSTKAIEPGI